MTEVRFDDRGLVPVVVQQWDTAVRAEAAQRDSRFMSRVNDRGTITGEAFTINFLGDDGGVVGVATGGDDDGNGATGDGATGYDDNNDGNWQ